MRKGSHRHRSAIGGLTGHLAWAATSLASLALLANLLVWALYAPSMAVGVTTPICTPSGTVDLPTGDAAPASADIDGRHCPLGMLASSLATAPTAAAAPVPPPLAVERLPGETRTLVASVRFTAWSARAPPTV